MKCSKGYYETDGVCTVCPIGSYSTESGSTECTTCEAGMSTLQEAADKASDCIGNIAIISSSCFSDV